MIKKGEVSKYSHFTCTFIDGGAVSYLYFIFGPSLLEETTLVGICDELSRTAREFVYITNAGGHYNGYQALGVKLGAIKYTYYIYDFVGSS